MFKDDVLKGKKIKIISDRTYNDIVASEKYTYASFIKSFDSKMKKAFSKNLKKRQW